MRGLVVVLVWVGTVRGYGEYGERCDPSAPCHAPLVCEEERCGCGRPDTLVYDGSRGACVALLGEECGLEEEAVRTPCVAGSVCGTSGLCVCPSGFYPDAVNHRCTPPGAYGAVCGQDYECSTTDLLACVQGHCGCDPQRAAFRGGVCVGRAGYPCSSPDSRCVPNAFCEEDTGRCRCNPGSAITPDHFCHVRPEAKEMKGLAADLRGIRGEVSTLKALITKLTANKSKIPAPTEGSSEAEGPDDMTLKIRRLLAERMRPTEPPKKSMDELLLFKLLGNLERAKDSSSLYHILQPQQPFSPPKAPTKITLHHIAKDLQNMIL